MKMIKLYVPQTDIDTKVAQHGAAAVFVGGPLTFDTIRWTIATSHHITHFNL